MSSASQLLFLWQTESRHPISDVCEFQFWQCCDSSCHVFLRILAVSMLHLIDPSSIEHKCLLDSLSNAFAIQSPWFLSVSVCVCLSTDRLSNDYVRNSLPSFNKFCTPLRNVVVSNDVVSGTNRKYINDFREVQNPILAVSRLAWTYFPTDRHKNPNRDITNQRWLCTRWSTKPE